MKDGESRTIEPKDRKERCSQRKVKEAAEHPSSNIRQAERNAALTKKPQIYLIIRTGNNCGDCVVLVVKW